MNRIFFLFLLLGFFAGSLFAQKTPAKPANTTAKPSGPSVDTLQYSLGAYFAQWMQKNGFTMSNPTLLKKGMDDVFQNKPMMVNGATVENRILSYQVNTQKERSQQQELNLFASLKNISGVGNLPDGVSFIVLKSGQGARPGPKDSVLLNVVGKTPDGTVFENTIESKIPIYALPGDLIPGLGEAVQLMQEGTLWQVFIPAYLGYGSVGLANKVPPNSALVIEVGLLQVRPVKK